MRSSPPCGLTLVLGPANSGKLGRVLEWWEARLVSRPLVVVPTVPDAGRLSAEMAQRSGALVGQSPSVTFDGLVRLLLGRSPRYAGDFQRLLLISLLLHESPPRAAGFSARFPGIVGVAGSLVEELGDSGRSPEEIDRALSRLGVGRWGLVLAGGRHPPVVRRVPRPLRPAGIVRPVRRGAGGASCGARLDSADRALRLHFLHSGSEAVDSRPGAGRPK